MPKVNRYVCFLNSLRHEDGNLSGQIVTDSNGAVERWGINQSAFPDVDVNGLTFQDAIKVYNDLIWPSGLDNVPSQILANMVFDFGFNHGMKSSVMTLQKVLGVSPDGDIGPQTLATIAGRTIQDLTMALAEEISAVYTSLGGPDLPGWLARVAENVVSSGW